MHLNRRNTCTITGAALQAGSKNPDCITKVFKEITGCTPTPYIDRYIHCWNYK